MVLEKTYCATHTEVESYLRCQRCRRLICPSCLMHTLVGPRCRWCARPGGFIHLDARPGDLLKGAAIGFAVALAGGVVLVLPIAAFQFFNYILVLGLGYAVGQAVHASANRRRGASLAVVAVVTLVLGVLLAPALVVLFQFPTVPLGVLLRVSLDPGLLRLVLLAVAALLAWHQAR